MMIPILFKDLKAGREFKQHPTSVVVYQKTVGVKSNALIIKPGRMKFTYIEANTTVYIDEDTKHAA